MGLWDSIRSWLESLRPRPPRPNPPPPVPAYGALLAAVTAARAARGLGTLAPEPALASLAHDWAAKMSASGSLAHRPVDQIAAAAPGRPVGECIAMGFPTAEACVNGWLSEGPPGPGTINHYAIVLGPYAGGGGGVARD